jgi:outer membrane immunogenic protein
LAKIHLRFVQGTRGRRPLEASMRWLVCGLSIAIASPALAADYDDSWLRGSQVVGPPAPPPSRLYRNWSGVYGGVQVGEDFRGIDFRDVPANPLASAISQDAILNLLSGALPGMPSLPQVSTRGPSYGGFLGYNWQIDDMVFGAELNALHQNAYNLVTRSYVVTSGGNIYAPTIVNVTSAATVDMSDYFTARGRLGWAFAASCPISSPASHSRRSTATGTSASITPVFAFLSPTSPASMSAAGTRSTTSVMANMSSASTPPSAWITC